MSIDIETMKREVRHLPPLARARAERELGLPSSPQTEHKVFVYGTLLAGERNAHWARDAHRENASAVGTIYDTGYGFPAFTREGATVVKGELLTVDDEGFRSMDRLEGCPRLYRRERIQVSTAAGNATAWVYIMNQLPVAAKVIESGDWRRRG